MSAFEDFVNLELPRRSAFLSSSIAGGYDDNPNLPAAPAILQSSPVGSWYYEPTAEIWWRKNTVGATTWVAQSAGGVGEATTGAITLAVSPTGSDGTVSGRPDRILEGNYSAFPYATIQAAVDAVPLTNDFPVNINVAAGTYSGFYIRSRTMGQDFTISGAQALASPTTGPNTGTATNGNASQLVLLGAGWTSGDLRGKFIEITSGSGAGQIFAIGDNAVETIRFAGTMSPAPGPGSGFRIVEPSVLINAPDTWFGFVGVMIANSMGFLKLEDIKVINQTFNVFAFNYPGRLILERIAVSGGVYGIGAQDTLQCRWSHLTISNTILAAILQIKVQTGGNNDEGWALHDNTGNGYQGEAVGAIRQQGVYTVNNGGFGVSATNGPLFTFVGHRSDGDDTAVRAQACFLEMEGSQIDNAAIETFDIFDARVAFEASLTGSGNAGFGLDAAGFNNRIVLNFMTPTITGSSGQVTVDGTTDVLWTNLNTPGDSAENAPSGDLIYRRG